MANVLILGCGDTGGRLAESLARSGHQVTGVRRSEHHLPGGRMLAADFTRPFSLDTPAPDYVFIILSPDDMTRAGYERTYLGGLGHIREALRPWRPRRVFLVSSTSVYGQDAGEWVDEGTPPCPKGFNGAVLLQAEAMAMAAWPVTVVRFGGIYGPGRERLLRWVQAGRPVEPGQWTNRIHVEDAARVLEFLLQRAQSDLSLQPLYLGVDTVPALMEDVLDGIAMSRGWPPVSRLPAPAAASGRRIRPARLIREGFEWLYPDWSTGYGC